jgi:enoyl-CoA hydratase
VEDNGREEFVSTQRDGAVVTLTLDRPGARNAMNLAMRRSIVRLVRELDADPEIAALIVTGRDPAFSAGVDLKESTSASDPSYERTNPAQALRAATTPVIAAVNGPCVTGALEVALSCSFIVASERAVFADTHARVGLIAGWGLSALLPRAVGIRHAREMSATGNFVSASEAMRIGLVNRVVAHDALLPAARRLAADIAGADPAAVARTFQLLDEGEGATLAHALGLEAEAVSQWQTSREGTARLLDASIARGSAILRRDESALGTSVDRQRGG